MATDAEADWSQFQGNAAHTGYVSGTYDPLSFIPIWSSQITDPELSIKQYGMAIDQSRLYYTVYDNRRVDTFFHPSHIMAVDTYTGIQAWTRELLANGSNFSSPSINSSTVYIHRYGNSGGSNYPTADWPALVGLSTSTGQVRFTTPHEGQWGNGGRPTITSTQVFAAGGHMGGLDAYSTNGSRRWFVGSGPFGGWSPAADYNYTYHSSNGGGLEVTRRSDGQSQPYIRDPGAYFASPVNETYNIVLGSNNTAYMLSAAEEYASFGRPRRLIKFDLTTQSVAWAKNLPIRSGGAAGIMALSNNELLVPSTTGLYAYDATTGDLNWTWDTPLQSSGNAVVTDSHVFVFSNSTLFAIDLSTHESVWSTPINNGKRIAMDHGVLYIQRSDGITAFRIATPAPVHFHPTFDAQATWNGSSFDVADGDVTHIAWHSSFNHADDRGVMEFSLDDVPDNALITNATLTLDVNAFSYHGDYGGETFYPILQLLGYRGNGQLDISDATAATFDQLIGVSDPVNAGGTLTIELDAEFIQTLIGSEDFLGLLAIGDPEEDWISWYSLESLEGEEALPHLNISFDFAPLLTGDANNDGTVDEADYRAVEKYFGLTGVASGYLPGDANDDGRVDGADMLFVDRHFGESLDGPATPEPATALLLLLPALVLTPRRRPTPAV